MSGLLSGGYSYGILDVNVKTFNVKGDGVTDDSANIRLALAAAVGRTLFFPNATYLVSSEGVSAWCLNIPSNIVIQGESVAGTIIKMKSGQATSVRPLNLQTVTDVTIKSLTIDGNKAGQDAEDHRAGIYMDASTRITIVDVLSHQNAGDGIDVHDSNTGLTQDILITRTRCINNGRYGVVLNGGGQKRVTVRDCRLSDNLGASFHIELSGDPVSEVLVEACVIGRPIQNDDYGVSFRGYGANLSNQLTLRKLLG
jgi:hypothetical protein